MNNNINISWKEFNFLPLRFKDYFIERANEIKKSRRKAFDGLKN